LSQFAGNERNTHEEVVRDKYGQAALRVKSGAGNARCGDDTFALEGSCDPITSNLYDSTQEAEVPGTALKASLGCGNPTALAEFETGVNQTQSL
jgi:arsenite methyltransferase